MTEPTQPEVVEAVKPTQPIEDKPVVETPQVVQPEPVVEAPVEVPVPTEPVVDPVIPTFELPTGVTERTREQFDKLTDSNTKLLEANRVLQAELVEKVQSEDRIAPLQ